MSVTHIDNDTYEFFVMEESFDRTNLGQKSTGDIFNIEQSLRMSDQLDGHILSGHIDTTGQVDKIVERPDGSKDIYITYDERFSKYTIEKGWIAINGVSLTIVDENIGWLKASIIPLTSQKTNIGNLQVGQPVNLEFDEKAKLIARYLDKMHNYK